MTVSRRFEIRWRPEMDVMTVAPSTSRAPDRSRDPPIPSGQPKASAVSADAAPGIEPQDHDRSLIERQAIEQLTEGIIRGRRRSPIDQAHQQPPQCTPDTPRRITTPVEHHPVQVSPRLDNRVPPRIRAPPIASCTTSWACSLEPNNNAARPDLPRVLTLVQGAELCVSHPIRMNPHFARPHTHYRRTTAR